MFPWAPIQCERVDEDRWRACVDDLIERIYSCGPLCSVSAWTRIGGVLPLMVLTGGICSRGPLFGVLSVSACLVSMT